jgi:hypothetical protein
MTVRRWFLAAGTALTLVACGGDEPARPGTLLVRLTSTGQARAVRFRLAGPGMVVAEPGTGAIVVSRVVSADTVLVAAFAPAGATLDGTAVAAIQVPDTKADSRYTVTLLEAASASYAIMPGGVVTLSIVPQ